MSEFLFPAMDNPSATPEGWFTAHCDGGSRGNPGPSGYGAVIEDPKGRVVSDSELMVKQMKGQYKVASPGLRPLWEEAKRLAGRLERFEMRHTLRGGNQEADRLANEAMDQGMGKTSKEPSGPQVAAKTGVAHGTAKPANPPKPPAQTLDGYVKGGVVHLLEGDLPDGTFVKVIRQ